jgi:small nuclear ribonucleoprotein (snRNP)-like protein
LHTVTLNANRQVTGVLRGFDQFMNMVLDGTVDVKNKIDIGMVVGVLSGWAAGQHNATIHAGLI